MAQGWCGHRGRNGGDAAIIFVQNISSENN